MTSSPDLRAPAVLRGASARAVPAARLDADLRRPAGAGTGGTGSAFAGRLADPALQRAFDETAEQVRAAARAEGYARGWAAGHEAATREVTSTARETERARQAEVSAWQRDSARAVAALQQAAAGLEARAVAPATELRESVLAAAVELAETLLGRELALATDPGLDALRRALTLAPAGRPVTARLHPGDLARTAEALAAMPADSLGREVRLVPDETVEPAGCLVECDATRVDAQLSTALGRVRAVLAT